MKKKATGVPSHNEFLDLKNTFKKMGLDHSEIMAEMIGDFRRIFKQITKKPVHNTNDAYMMKVCFDAVNSATPYLQSKAPQLQEVKHDHQIVIKPRELRTEFKTVQESEFELLDPEKS